MSCGAESSWRRAHIHSIVVDRILVGHSVQLLIAVVKAIRRVRFDSLDMQPMAFLILGGTKLDESVFQGDKFLERRSNAARSSPVKK
jgi:hypothetical protein